MTEMFEVDHTDQGVNVSIGTELTIYSAAPLKEELLTLLRASPNLTVSLAKVNEIDTSGIQILAMMKQEAELLQHTVSFTEHSEPVINVLELMNMVSYFGDPLVLPR